MKYQLSHLSMLLLLSIVLVSCTANRTAAPDTGLQVIPIHSKSVATTGDYYYDADNLKELQKLSDYIVQGTLLDDARQKLYYSDPDIIKTASFGITVSSYKITKSLKGNLKAGETIKIAERYFTQEIDGEMIQYLLDYGPSEPNRDYIFFLNKEENKNEFLKGYYSPTIREKGRYPVLNKPLSVEITSQDINDFTLVGVSEEKYLSLFEEVRVLLNVNSF